MAEKQALNATFFAFRKREKGGVLTMATIAYILIAIVIFGLFGWLNFAAILDYFGWITQVGINPQLAATPPASIIALGPMLFLLQIFYYVIAAAYEAACLRWMVRGEAGGFLGFTLGADTWRVYFTYWIWFFLAIVAGISFLIPMFALGAGAALGAQDGGANGGMGAAMLIPILFLIWLVLIIYVSVRLAPAAATSIARNRFAFFDAWKVTKGRFWALLGAFVLLFLMYCVAYVVLSVIAGVAIGMGAMGAMSETTAPEDVMAMFAQPQVLAPLIIVYGAMIVGAFVFMVAMFGVNARAAALALEEGKITAET